MNQDDVRKRAIERLHEMASQAPCVCTPYRGGRTKARHLPSCVWDSWYDGFLDGLACAGISADSLPDVMIARMPALDDDPPGPVANLL